MTTEEALQDQFHQLAYYTLAHNGKNFIHQHVVDAFAAQNASANTKPITLFFALAGLYLFVEKGVTGRQVQNTHLLFSRKTKQFPLFQLPNCNCDITVSDVMALPAGIERDDMIRKWCGCVWASYKTERGNVISFTDKLLNSGKV